MKISWKLGPLDQEEKFRSFFWLEDSGVARATALDKEGIHANHSSFSLRNSLSLSLSLSLSFSLTLTEGEKLRKKSVNLASRVVRLDDSHITRSG